MERPLVKTQSTPYRFSTFTSDMWGAFDTLVVTKLFFVDLLSFDFTWLCLKMGGLQYTLSMSSDF